jgi:hypothetical protein
MFKKDDSSYKLYSKDIPNLVSVLHSINEPKIGLEGFTPQRAKAYICTLQHDGDTFLLHVFLYLPEPNSYVSYGLNEGAFAAEKHKFVEEKALDFLERMGFMMDNLNIQNLSIQEREEVLRQVPIVITQTREIEFPKTVTDPNVTELERFLTDPPPLKEISEKTDKSRVQAILRMLASY